MQGDFLFSLGGSADSGRPLIQKKSVLAPSQTFTTRELSQWLKWNPAPQACGAGLTLSFTILPCLIRVFLLCKIPLEKCSSKIFLIKFIKSTAGVWMCCLPRSEEQEGVSEHRHSVCYPDPQGGPASPWHTQLSYWSCLQFMPGPEPLTCFRMLP